MTYAPRIRDMATGLAAVVALLAIVAGVPAALVTFVGWPLPDAWPGLDTVATALRYGQVAPGTLLKALAVGAWATWLLMTAGILVEVVALARGTVARALPTMGALQHLAGRLLTAAMLLSTLTARPAAAAVAPPPVTVADAEVRAGQRADDAGHVDDTPTYIVRRHDSLWTIAERTLGDGHRWREIRDLNAGRRQADGGALRTDDLMIQPGWELRLPPSAVLDQPVSVEVGPGDDLWSIAETHLGDGEAWRRIYDRNAGVTQRDGGTLEHPGVIRPGWVLELPDAGRDRAPDGATADGSDRGPTPEGGDRPRADATPDAADQAPHDAADDGSDRPGALPDHLADPRHRTDRGAGHDTRRARGGADRPAQDRDGTATSPPAPLATTPWTLPDGRADHGATGHGDDVPPARGTGVPPVPAHGAAPPAAEAAGSLMSEHRPQRRPDVLPGAGIALLAAGLVGVLASRRRHWLRHRRPGSALEPVDAETAELERWLRAMADHDLSHRTERVQRVLAEHFAAHELHPPVIGLEIGDQIRLLLSSADVSPPPGLSASDDGLAWTLDAELEVAAPRSHEGPPFLPALVAFGRRPGGAVVALSLLDVGVLGLDGPAPLVTEALTSWTAELATTGAADDVDIVVVGPHHDLVEQFARVTISDDADGALQRIDRTLGRVNGSAGARVVVLSGAPASGDAWDALLARADEDPRLAVVTPLPAAADHVLVLSGAQVRLAPHGTFDAPEWLTPETWDRFDDLLRQPVRQQHADLVPSPLLAAPARSQDLTAVDVYADEPTWTVRVLGPLAVDGAPRLSDAAADLLAFLAVNRQGATSATLTSHLGLDEDALRALLAEIDDRSDGAAATVAKGADGRHRLADDVASDIERLHDLTHGLDGRPPGEQAIRLQQALTPVRGVPFCDAAAWAQAGGLATATTALVSDAAHRLTTLFMTFGDLDRAAWAVDRGLVANPGCELLHRDRMRIADARGDHDALDAVMRDLRSHAAADDGWVTPESLQLYERLKRATTITAAPVAPTGGRRHAS